MICASYAPGARGDVHVFDAAALPWQPTAEPGLRMKPVRYDNERGLYLGLVAFDALSRSGMHQHRGVASSFVAAGALTDYQGTIGCGQMGINLPGATHDAIAYAQTLLVSRLEGPVAYPTERTDLTGLHAGSLRDDLVNRAPDVLPDINVDVDRAPLLQTGVPGLVRQPIFDYAGTGSAHRLLQWRLAPGCHCPAWRASAAVELWVRGGQIEVNGQTAHGNCFVIIEPDATVQMRSRYGALLLCWAEGPEAWGAESGAAPSHALRPSLFGF